MRAPSDSRCGAASNTSIIEDGTGDEVRYAYAYVGDLVTARASRRRGVGKLLLEECERPG